MGSTSPRNRAGQRDADPGATEIGLLRIQEVGRLHLADISILPLLYRWMGIEVGDPFGAASVVALGTDGEMI